MDLYPFWKRVAVSTKLLSIKLYVVINNIKMLLTTLAVQKDVLMGRRFH